MRSKKLLVIVLLGVSFCFVPGAGYGEIKEWMYEAKASFMDVHLLQARVNYMMTNPTLFLRVYFDYDPDGSFREDFENFPEDIDTKNKICVMVFDNRGIFSYKSGIALLDEFKRQLENIYWFIQLVATDMNTDIVAEFHSKGGIPLGYFYQGGYHLWEE